MSWRCEKWRSAKNERIGKLRSMGRRTFHACRVRLHLADDSLRCGRAWLALPLHTLVAPRRRCRKSTPATFHSGDAAMTDVFASVGPLLLQGGAVLRDTVIVKQVAVERGWLEQLAAVASVIITISLMVLTVFAVPALWRFRRTYRKVDHLLERIYSDITPIMHNAHVITDNVNFVTTSIRNDIDKVNATINGANERVQQAVLVSEKRLNEFNALLAVVQQEAEQLFLSTASTVRGVRHGAATFRDEGGMDFASDELDTADLAADLVLEEEGDGHHSSTQPAAPALPAAPRVRPRAGRRA
jgi:uncharacterized protein YoxC